MRTLMKGKRLWPLLALASVVALAAALAIGLGSPGAIHSPPVADAQGRDPTPPNPAGSPDHIAAPCKFSVDGTSTAGTDKVCYTTGSDAEITVRNGGSLGRKVIIFATGASASESIPGGIYMSGQGVGDSNDAQGKAGLARWLNLNLGTGETMTATVRRSWADSDDKVYVSVYDKGLDYSVPVPHSSGELRSDEQLDSLVVVHFLDPFRGSLTSDTGGGRITVRDVGDDDPDWSSPANSAVTAATGDARRMMQTIQFSQFDGNQDGTSQLNIFASPTNDTDVNMGGQLLTTLTFEEGMGRATGETRNPVVNYGDPKVYRVNRSTFRGDTIRGWDPDGPAKITMSVAIDPNPDDDDVEPIEFAYDYYVVIPGPAAKLNVKEGSAATDSDLEAEGGQDLTVRYTLTDALDTGKSQTVTWEGADARSRAVIDATGGTGSDTPDSDGDGEFTVTIRDNAAAGKYMLRLKTQEMGTNEQPLAQDTVEFAIIGDAANFAGSVHKCAANSEATDAQQLMCGGATSGMSPVATTGTPEFNWGDTFYVVAYHHDSADNIVNGAIGSLDATNGKASWAMTRTMPAGRIMGITPTSVVATTSSGGFTGVTAVTVGIGAPAGDYRITVTDARTGTGITRLAPLTLDFSIADQPAAVASYRITGADSVVSGTARYTITALDADNNRATLRADAAGAADDDYVNNKVSLVVTGSGADAVTIRVNGQNRDLDTNSVLELDTMGDAAGTTTFDVFVPPGTASGQVTFTILPEGKAVQAVSPANKTITVGQSFGNSVAAERGSGNAITASWQPSPSAEQQVVVVVNQADTTDYCLNVLSATATSSTCAGRMATATYVVVVIALLPGDAYELGNVVIVTPAAASGS